jgi:hypothetical protein
VEIFRVTKSVYGQETLIGVSWQLFWWFAGVALLFVAVHMIYKWFYAPDGENHTVGANNKSDEGDTAVS